VLSTIDARGSPLLDISKSDGIQVIYQCHCFSQLSHHQYSKLNKKTIFFSKISESDAPFRSLVFFVSVRTSQKFQRYQELIVELTTSYFRKKISEWTTH